ncbi:HNH endonuclease [Carbonactinospora thermoautotrophica]|uniref:Endonuclease n=1 Tax=Carbonactinospora thermoautotrophica TaxID=1469144 RepID=A0A132MQC6_9ACTN|nr:HNH endonuclease [Carbonactinospora thermoautotrophica]KWX00039.1 endonuclease [Carbonactinospora thermoautotrophica]KWX02048.1 HNH endonuclease [Carbonactinospora thermoautotrophica]KWX08785.1 endonuclease [Carbonactinospora thermoautotrophica]MCX9189973.1 HNH endonuclease [Carbonactinospora thermoautotrophica]
MPHALVLNATYEPLGVVPQRRALILVLNQKAVTVEESENVLHSATRAIPAPCVVRLTRYVRVPHRGAVPLTRRALFARDGGRCVYCGAPATSVDHVIPRSRGGQHTWENVVSACRRCNHIKADRHVSELGWRLRKQPRQPTGIVWRIISSGRSDPRWVPYLAAFGGGFDLDYLIENVSA